MPMLDTLTVSHVDESGHHGEVFTRRWVVDLILDLCGYTAEANLADMVLAEPACGGGAFLLPTVERLSASLRSHGLPLAAAGGAIRAWDLKASNVALSQAAVTDVLVELGWEPTASSTAARTWIRQADFLLAEHEFGSVDVVIGNPPYVRLEDMAEDRARAYGHVCETMIGRSDLFIGFFEIGLRLLRPGGVLGYICADRWMRNQYGRGLRQFIVDRYSVDATIVMHDVDAFEEEVSAYPAVTVISARPQESAVIATATREFGPRQARHLSDWARSGTARPRMDRAFSAARLPHWFADGDLWPWGSPARLALLEHLNDSFGPLEAPGTGTRVGIGIATGNDSVFVVTSAPVEPDRLLPLVMRQDTASGATRWEGRHLVNPWLPDGSLVDLREYPRLAVYFEQHREALARRHTARRGDWYRTIDKVSTPLIDRPLLLLADLSLEIAPVLEPGGLYPHHNLYYVTSEEWNLEVLGGLLLSKVAEFFVSSYAVRMRGGTLRFQAQYLRRIRLPRPDQIADGDAAALAVAFNKRDAALATETALRIYDIDGIPE